MSNKKFKSNSSLLSSSASTSSNEEDNSYLKHKSNSVSNPINNLISKEDAAKEFTDFKEIYDEAIKVFGGTKYDLTSVEANYNEFTERIKSKKLRIVVANTGDPNRRKSSSFNFFMTGSHEYPLPNSSEVGIDGVTTKPTRCEFKDIDNFKVGAMIKVGANKDDQEKMFEENWVKEGDKIVSEGDKIEFHTFILEKMKEPEFREIIIHLPRSKFPDQAEQFKDFVFLDLIGLNNEQVNDKSDLKESDVELNKTAIKREYVDAVFVFPSNREMSTPHTIK